MFAALFASPSLVSALIVAGASPSQLSKAKYYSAPALHPLSLTILPENEDEACNIAGILLQGGALFSTAYDNRRTLFHEFFAARKTKLVAFLLKNGPKAQSVWQFPAIDWGRVIFPLSTALEVKDYAMVVTLIVYGAGTVFKEEDIDQEFIHSGKG